MLEAVRNLLLEIKAILFALRQPSKNDKVSAATVDRIQEFAVAWSVNVRPGLKAVGIPNEVLDRTDRLTSSLASQASWKPKRSALQRKAYRVWKVFLEQILLEVPRVPPARQAAFQLTIPAPLFPEITDLPNNLIPKSIQGWSLRIQKFLRKNPFPQNVFIMVSYHSRLKPLVDVIKQKLKSLDLNPILAKDHSLTDDLYNPIACLICCSYGVAIFDRAEAAQAHNPNVVYELGMMQLLNRPCVILKHHGLQRMPTDLLSRLYEDYSSKAEAVVRIGEWWTRNNN